MRPQARPRAKCFGRRVWLIGGIALRVLLLWPCFSVGIALKVLGCLWPCSVRDSVLRGLAPRGLALLGRMVLALRGPWAAGSSSQRALALRGADSQGIVSEGCGSHGVWGWLRMGVLVSRGRALKIFVSGSRASGVLALKVLCFRGLALGGSALRDSLSWGLGSKLPWSQGLGSLEFSGLRVPLLRDILRTELQFYNSAGA